MSYGYYGDGRQKSSPTKTIWYNGRQYHTDQKVIIKHAVAEGWSEIRPHWKTRELVERNGTRTTGEYIEVEGTITGFESNHRARPCIEYTVPEGDVDAGKIEKGLRNYGDFQASPSIC